MENKIKKILSMMCMLVAILGTMCMTSCNDDEEDDNTPNIVNKDDQKRDSRLIGTWSMTYTEGGITYITIVVLNADGTGTWTEDGDTDPFVWSTDNNKKLVTIFNPDTDPYPDDFLYEFMGETLKIWYEEEEDDAWYFTKMK